MKYSGSDWLKNSYSEKIFSSFGIEVADLLGQVWRGIYHMPASSLRKVNWSHPDFVEINIDKTLATFDYSNLTELIVLCHDRMIRLEINPLNFRYLKIYFHKRKTREGDICRKMPTIEDHIKEIRNHLSWE